MTKSISAGSRAIRAGSSRSTTAASARRSMRRSTAAPIPAAWSRPGSAPIRFRMSESRFRRAGRPAGWASTGTSGADRFDVSPSGQQWMTIRPGDGVDTIIIGGDATERAGGDQDRVRAARHDRRLWRRRQSRTGTIADDGFGNAETIRRQCPALGSARLGRATIRSSARRQLRILPLYRRRTTTSTAGPGSTGCVMIRSGVSSVVIDAEKGHGRRHASDGGGTFTDNISGFEWLRGSNGDDRSSARRASTTATRGAVVPIPSCIWAATTRSGISTRPTRRLVRARGGAGSGRRWTRRLTDAP